MGDLSFTADFELPPEAVWRFARNCHLDSRFLRLFQETAGYIPDIRASDVVDGRKIRYQVAGRDSLTKMKIAGWSWTFVVEPISEAKTRFTVSYSWPMSMGLLSAGTAEGQARNEMSGYIVALASMEDLYGELNRGQQ